MEPLDRQPPQGRSRGRLTVVSGYAHDPLTPRGQRTQRLLERLAEEWEIELVALPAETFGSGGPARPKRPLWRRAASRAADATLLDRWEPWSARRLAPRWRPDADAALLIAYPWSPVTYAARRLRAAGIPYVLDAGDPWGLTAPVPIGGWLSRGRWRRAERALWAGAAAAVMTTGRQADVLSDFFPELPVLVRANGYEPLEPSAGSPASRPPSRDCLRLVHYGSLPHLRVDPTRLLRVLAASGRWDAVRLTQFGEDYVGLLARAPSEVEIEWRAPLPWSEVIAGAGEFDLAVAVGNVLPGQLPSKAVQYMTLPIPRLAVTARSGDDALAEYVRDKPGWAAAAWDDPAADRVVAEHLAHDWSPAALAPPREEGWPAVAERIASFVTARLTAAPDPSPVAYAAAQTEAP